MKCFIISPIGQPGSAAREHADDVFECIIKPTLKEADIDGHRADHVQDVGRITKQMYDEILTSDFCIAVLHGFNPNVFYELASGRAQRGHSSHSVKREGNRSTIRFERRTRIPLRFDSKVDLSWRQRTRSTFHDRQRATAARQTGGSIR